jgi:hypothetical protein
LVISFRIKHVFTKTLFGHWHGTLECPPYLVGLEELGPPCFSFSAPVAVEVLTVLGVPVPGLDALVVMSPKLEGVMALQAE